MELDIENKISLFNEIMAFLYLCVCITLTGLPNDKLDQCGVAIVVIISATILVNLFKTVYMVCKEARKVKCTCRKAKKE